MSLFRRTSGHGVRTVGTALAASVTTDAVVFPSPCAPRYWSIFFATAGSPTSMTYTVQFTPDSEGTTWCNLGAQQTVTFNGGQAVVSVADVPACGARVVLGTFTGGAAQTATVSIGWSV